MFKRLIKNKKGQNTAEYAILISLVVASIVAMQTYAQRALNARVKDAADGLTDIKIGTVIDGNTKQYEPYYQKSEYTVNTDSEVVQDYGKGKLSVTRDDTTTRGKNGYQESTYNSDDFDNR